MSDTTDHGRIRRALAEAQRAHEAATEALRRAEDAAVAAGAEVVAHHDAITVQRINVVEPDGTLRLVITNASQLPGLILRGEEHAHPNRNPASGLIFFNDEATEMGGLTFGGLRSSGGYSSGVHLSYDDCEQDQVIVLSSSDDGRAARVAHWSSSIVPNGRSSTSCGPRRRPSEMKPIRMWRTCRGRNSPDGCAWPARPMGPLD